MKRESFPRVQVRVVRRFNAPADRVFGAWIDPAIAGKWLFATASRPVGRVRICARVGGRFCFSERGRGVDIVHAGEYTEIARPYRLAFKLSERCKARSGGAVRVRIAPLGAGCELTLVHDALPPDQAPAAEGRWAGMLYGLQHVLESRR